MKQFISIYNRRLYLILCVLLFTITIYINHFNNGFHFDDNHTISNNSLIRQLSNIPKFFLDGSTSSTLPQNQVYRPVVSTTLAIDYWIGNGYNPIYFHLSMFILFLLQGSLMFFLFLKILDKIDATKKQNFYIALAAAGWYLVHPAIAETVNYIIARSDILSTFFVVLALTLYTSSAFSRKTYLYLVPVIIGALAKPSSVMFAPLLFFYILLFDESVDFKKIFKFQYRYSLIRAIKKSVPSFVICILLYGFISLMTPSSWVPGGTSRLSYLITQPFVVLHYFYMFILPTELSADTDWTTLQSIFNFRFLIGILFLLATGIIIIYTSSKKNLKPISFGLIWFLITLFPTSSIIPLAEVLNDHRMFFPFIGLSLSITYSIYLIVEFYYLKYRVGSSFLKYSLFGITIIVFITYGIGTYNRNKVWSTEESLWYDVTIKSPLNGRGLMNYGLVKMEQGKYLEADKYFNKALELTPNYSYLFVNLAIVKNALGDSKTAENYFKKAIQLGNDFAGSHSFYARFLKKQFRLSEAEIELQKAIKISPNILENRISLLEILELESSWSELSLACLSALEISPNNTIVLNYLEHSKLKKGTLDYLVDEISSTSNTDSLLQLSLKLFQVKRFDECIQAAKRAVDINPKFYEAYNNIGAAFNAKGQYEKSILPLEKAVQLNPNYQLAKNNLVIARSMLNKGNLLSEFNNVTPEMFIQQSLNYFNNQEFDKCILVCKKALILRPNYDIAYNNICASYNKLKNWDQAIVAAKKGLQINPNNQLLKNNLQVALDAKNTIKQ
jgi:tetratricopeptide (TPR) repeat protein